MRESLYPVVINDAILERFLRQLKSQGLSNHCVRQVRAMLHRACRLARKWTGARRGELCALCWSDIDWDACTVRFDEALALLQGAAVAGLPRKGSPQWH